MNLTTSLILEEIQSERNRQIKKGYTPDNDDYKTDFKLINISNRLIGEWIITRDRTKLIEAASVIVALVEKMDRGVIHE